MPVFVYILESEMDGTWYVGMTTNIEIRLKEHNAGKSRFTKGHFPWKIIYFEEQPDFVQGRTKEKYFKTTNGKNRVRKWIAERNSGSLPA
ncbi:MAG TPA: GIY-YIG nuclease family protein [Catalimonadaceae bacterium]|nr:GIY-YIG nuclease family protein [Catalimonadaceae bacterium]